MKGLLVVLRWNVAHGFYFSNRSSRQSTQIRMRQIINFLWNRGWSELVGCRWGIWIGLTRTIALSKHCGCPWRSWKTAWKISACENWSNFVKTDERWTDGFLRLRTARWGIRIGLARAIALSKLLSCPWRSLKTPSTEFRTRKLIQLL